MPTSNPSVLTGCAHFAPCSRRLLWDCFGILKHLNRADHSSDGVGHWKVILRLPAFSAIHVAARVALAFQPEKQCSLAADRTRIQHSTHYENDNRTPRRSG